MSTLVTISESLLRKYAESTSPFLFNPALLPILDIWDWARFIIDKPTTIKPKETINVYDKVGAGWIFYACVAVDNPDIQVLVDVQAGDGKIELRISPKMLKELGMAQRGGGFAVTNYDPNANIYVMEYAPGTGFLGVPFRGRNRLDIYNPTNVDATVEVAYAWLIMFKEKVVRG